MKEIGAQELKKMIDSKEDFQLIDVREPWEVEEVSIGGINIPMGDVILRSDEISKDKKTVIYCKAGMRSATVINTLEQKFGYTNLFNLKGGIVEYLNNIRL